jgi:hypothetical protein
MRTSFVIALLHLDAKLRVMVQDQKLENAVDDLDWSLADEVLRWINFAIEGIWKVVLVAWPGLKSLYVFFVARQDAIAGFGRLDLLRSGVVARSW